MKVDIGPLLPGVQKPGRYIGGEVNQVRKDPGAVAVRFALCFPDVYEIGMSYPGLQILYKVLNDLPWCGAERCFAVWPDMERQMRAQALPLFALESHDPVGSFDVLGFSLHYELSYTQVLNMLDMAGLPTRAAQRDEGHPLVVAGGPCAMNPEPLAPFVDAFFLGEGEDGIREIAEAVRDAKAARAPRAALFETLARIPGVYVPSLYEIECLGTAVSRFAVRPPAPAAVSRRVLPALDATPYPVAQLVPHVSAVHDRLVVEIQRGCTRGCRFCHAGIVYRPTRMRSPASVLEIVDRALKTTGHDEVSLLSLSAGDYAGLSGLLFELMRRHGPERVSLSLPSMRVEALAPMLVEEIKKVRKTGFTIAPEAGSQRLRDVINKGNTEDDLFQSVERAFAAGWNVVKLYFMVGLPTETEDDIAAIADLCQRALRIGRSSRRGARFNVSVSTFVPKAHTPFQWEGILPLPALQPRLALLRERFRRMGVNASVHPPEQAHVEAVLARGDRRAAPAIERAWRDGARLEAWNENFSPDRWRRAFEAMEGVTAGEVSGPRDPAARLPWDHIATGVTREYLLEERARGLRGERTVDCLDGPCGDCGVCTADNGIKPLGAAALPVVTAGAWTATGAERPDAKPSRLRLRYSRRGFVAYLGHLDVMGLWAQAVRRSGLPVEYTKGFHPKTKVAFGPACPVGVESAVEYLDVELKRKVDPGRAAAMLGAFLVDGLKVVEAFSVPLQTPSLSVSIRALTYRFDFVETPRASPSDRAAAFMAKDTFPVTRTKEGRTRTFDLRASVQEVRVEGVRTAQVTVGYDAAGSARLAEIMEHVFGLGERERTKVRIERIAVSFG